MIELDTVKKDMEKQKVILASLTFYANVLTRPGLPPSQTASMVLPDLINHETHETSAAEAGSHPSQGRMIMPPNGQLYEARHRPGAPSMQVHPVSPHHVQAQINQRVQQTPAQFQNSNIYHFPPHHDQRRTQHMVNHSSPIPMPSVQRSSPVTIAPTPISQTQTSNIFSEWRLLAKYIEKISILFQDSTGDWRRSGSGIRKSQDPDPQFQTLLTWLQGQIIGRTDPRSQTSDTNTVNLKKQIV